MRSMTEAITADDPAELEATLAKFALDRVAAAAALPADAAPEPWPAPQPDPFAGLSGQVPEIRGAELTPAVLAGAIIHHGALVVRGMVRDEDVARLHHGLESASAALESVTTPTESALPWFVPLLPRPKNFGLRSKSKVVRLADAPLVMEDVLATYHRIGLIEAIGAYFGEPPVFTAEKSVLRRMPLEMPIPTDWHQDGRFMGADTRSVNVWVALSDCGTNSPSLDVVPRREPGVASTGQGDNGLDWTLSTAQVEAIAGATPPVRLEFAAGDGLVFDHFLIHRTAYAETMTEVRRAIECWFFAPSHAPDKYQKLLA